MILINKHILEFFIDKNRISAFRLYAFIKHAKNNHLHYNDISWICTELHISRTVFWNNIKVLEKLGVCSNHSDNYWRFHSYHKWCPTNKNRLIKVKIQNFRCLKYLRTLYYALQYRTANIIAKRNAAKERNTAISSGFAETSSSFVLACTGIEKTQSTLLKHLKRAENFGMVYVRRSKEVIDFSLDLSDLSLSNFKNPTVIKKIFGIYYQFLYNSNYTKLRI